MSTSIHPPQCPYCGVAMQVQAMGCSLCQVEVRGKFRQPMFHLLSSAEQELLEQYLLADFSIKDLAARSGMGYAAIRSRLDQLIEHYRQLRSREDEKKRILARVSDRTLSVAEAADLIAQLEAETEGR